MAKKTAETTIKTEGKSIGVDAPFPKESCTDKNCPFHGTLKVHGRIIVGDVVSSKASKTATVSYSYQSFIPKYERYETKHTKVKAHNPSCINAKEGDKVRVMETRPLSKTKNFVVIQKLEE